jgi:ubiquinol-cytochrome c reductase cytochrome b subunit
MPRWLRAVGNWFDARFRLRETLLPMMRHPIPREAAGPMGWWYVFGSASLTLLLVQILTGIGLAMVYVASADKAYDSLLYMNYDQPLGWFLRALHYYAGSGMMVLVLAHMTQVFLHGAYKYPRESTWILGVLLLLCTLGMFFTGQILRWDPDAYWGLGIGGAMAGRVPVIGPWLVRQLFGGPVIGAESLSRFFSLHVFIIPALCCSSWPSISGWYSSAASVPHRSPARWSIRRPTTPNTRNNSRPASPSLAMP